MIPNIQFEYFIEIVFAVLIRHIFERLIAILELNISESHVIIAPYQFTNDFVRFQPVFVSHVDDIRGISGLFEQLILGYFYFIGLLPFALFLDCINIAADFKSEPNAEARGANIDDIL
jgi:hypothetical protein